MPRKPSKSIYTNWQAFRSTTTLLDAAVKRSKQIATAKAKSAATKHAVKAIGRPTVLDQAVKTYLKQLDEQWKITQTENTA